MTSSRAREISNLLSPSYTVSIGSSTIYDSINELPLSNVDNGSLSFVKSNSNLYGWSGNGWYKIITVNTDPVITQAPENLYTVSSRFDSSVTLSLLGRDSEEIPLLHSLSFDSNLSQLADLSFDSSQTYLQITPKSSDSIQEVVGYGGNSDVILSVTDGVNIVSSTSKVYISADSATPYSLGSALDSADAVVNMDNVSASAFPAFFVGGNPDLSTAIFSNTSATVYRYDLADPNDITSYNYIEAKSNYNTVGLYNNHVVRFSSDGSKAIIFHQYVPYSIDTHSDYGLEQGLQTLSGSLIGSNYQDISTSTKFSTNDYVVHYTSSSGYVTYVHYTDQNTSGPATQVNLSGLNGSAYCSQIYPYSGTYLNVLTDTGYMHRYNISSYMTNQANGSTLSSPTISSTALPSGQRASFQYHPYPNHRYLLYVLDTSTNPNKIVEYNTGSYMGLTLTNPTGRTYELSGTNQHGSNVPFNVADIFTNFSRFKFSDDYNWLYAQNVSDDQLFIYRINDPLSATNRLASIEFKYIAALTSSRSTIRYNSITTFDDEPFAVSPYGDTLFTHSGSTTRYEHNCATPFIPGQFKLKSYNTNLNSYLDYTPEKVFVPDNGQYIFSIRSNVLYALPMSEAWNVNSINTSNVVSLALTTLFPEDTTTEFNILGNQRFTISPDGKRLYLPLRLNKSDGSYEYVIREFIFGTSYDITTLKFYGVQFNYDFDLLDYPSVHFNANGTKLRLVGDYLHEKISEHTIITS